MPDIITITANWATGSLSDSMLSRQYDNNRYRIEFMGYPEDSAGDLLYYLLVWMRTDETPQGAMLAPIQMDSDQWLISNYFTQMEQQIRFQMCIQNESGTFEAHSPIFSGAILGSLKHDGEEIDIDTSALFDYYREYVNNLIIQSGAVVIDTDLDTSSTNPVQNKIVAGAVAELNERLTQQGTSIGDLSQLNTEEKTNLVAAINEAAQVDDTLTISGAAADAKAVGDALADKADSSDVTALGGSIEAIEDALEDKADKSDLDNLDMVQIADDFSASKTYAIGDYAVYAKKLYRCITAITTAEAWDSSKWIEISVMGDLGSRLDMLVTMQEIREEEDEPTSEIVQLINPEWITWQTVSSWHWAKISQRIPLKGNGAYYDNPYRAENTDPQNNLKDSKFYNAFGEVITFTKQGATETRTSFQFFTTYGCRFEISDGNILTLYVRGNEVSGVWVGDSEIAYMGADAGKKIFFEITEERPVGITYGGYSTTYVPYEGSVPVITHEYQYVPAMAEYVQRYMQIYGTAVSNAMFKRYYPDEDKTLAVNAFKYWHDRAERENSGVIRVANFNKFVSRQSGNWSVIKQELADYSVDVCGFEEALNITLNNKRLEEYLQGYQFTSGSDHDITGATECGKALVSHWEVDSTTVLSLVTTGSGVQYALKCVMTIPSGKWFSNFVDSDCTLSVYVWHGISTNATVDGASKTSLEIRQMEITALLAIMAQDTSDFIVVVADTNCFETGLDIQNNTHVEWEMFRTAGYTPILPGIESTVTGNVAASHFHVDGNGTAFCDACYDQIFVSSHITAEGYKVVDSNLYPVPAANNAPVSDHCMIYADLKFDFDAIMQEKLIAKMGV